MYHIIDKKDVEYLFIIKLKPRRLMSSIVIHPARLVISRHPRQPLTSDGTVCKGYHRRLVYDVEDSKKQLRKLLKKRRQIEYELEHWQGKRDIERSRFKGHLSKFETALERIYGFKEKVRCRQIKLRDVNYEISILNRELSVHDPLHVPPPLAPPLPPPPPFQFQESSRVPSRPRSQQCQRSRSQQEEQLEQQQQGDNPRQLSLSDSSVLVSSSSRRQQRQELQGQTSCPRDDDSGHLSLPRENSQVQQLPRQQQQGQGQGYPLYTVNEDSDDSIQRTSIPLPAGPPPPHPPSSPLPSPLPIRPVLLPTNVLYPNQGTGLPRTISI
jgi:hypothetical protein